MALLKRLKQTGKRAISPVISIIGAIIGIIPSLFKHKKFVLWYQEKDGKWIKKSLPMSRRQCEKSRDALWELGQYGGTLYLLSRFVILREGVAP